MHTTAAVLAGIQAEIGLNPFLIQNDMVLVLLLVYSYCDASSCQSIVGLSQSLLSRVYEKGGRVLNSVYTVCNNRSYGSRPL